MTGNDEVDRSLAMDALDLAQSIRRYDLSSVVYVQGAYSSHDSVSAVGSIPHWPNGAGNDPV